MSIFWHLRVCYLLQFESS